VRYIAQHSKLARAVNAALAILSEHSATATTTHSGSPALTRRSGCASTGMRHDVIGVDVGGMGSLDSSSEGTLLRRTATNFIAIRMISAEA
jgi:hypothetical protein